MKHSHVTLASCGRAMPRCFVALASFVLAVEAPAQLLYQIDGASFQVPGSSSSLTFGWTVCSVGDLNQDGFDDFMAGGGSNSANPSSSARVYSGADGSILFSLAPLDPDNTRHNVGEGGDVNADGVLDLVVGLPFWPPAPGSPQGKVFVFSGADGAILYTFDGTDPVGQFGSTVTASKDLNGDSFADILVTSQGSDLVGKCQVFSGADGSVLVSLEEPTISRYAYDADFAGDVNGDGVEDLVVGSLRDGLTATGATGSVRVYSGADQTELFVYFGDLAAGVVGGSVSAAGDVNRDGFDDVIVGAYSPQFPTVDRGYAVVLAGPNGQVLHRFETANPGVRMIGRDASGAGDVDGDGYDDLIVACEAGYEALSNIYIPGFIDEIYNTRGARIYSGRDGSLLQEVGVDLIDSFGWTNVSSAGDTNGDGVPDFLLGNPNFRSPMNQQIGLVRVFAGAADGFVEACNGDGGDQMGCTACPCSNDAQPGTVGGCLNSAGRSALLIASGSSSVSSDVLRMEMVDATANSFCALLSGDNLAPANAASPCFGQGSGVTFTGFDGLRCTVGSVQRHGLRATDGAGSVGQSSPAWGGVSSALLTQAGFVAGQTRHFQVIYREQIALGCGTGLNSTQSVSISFLP